MRKRILLGSWVRDEGLGWDGVGWGDCGVVGNEEDNMEWKSHVGRGEGIGMQLDVSVWMGRYHLYLLFIYVFIDIPMVW